MTNAQKWVAAFLGVFIILFFLSRVVKQDDAVVPDEIDQYMQEESDETAEEVSGLTLIQRNGCISCHGEDLKGKPNLGPGLYNAKNHWDEDGLVNYLRNPSEYSGDSRFDEYEEQYGNVMMPSYENLDVKDLGKISEYILNLE